MKTRGLTIARWMGATAILALNCALLRSVLVPGTFSVVVLMLFALEVGLWRLLRARGKRRRFWMGFEVCGAIVVLAVLSGLYFPDSPQARLADGYVGILYPWAVEYLPVVGLSSSAAHSQGVLSPDVECPFMAIVLFAPEFAAAFLGGLCAALAPFPSRLPHTGASAAAV